MFVLFQSLACVKEYTKPYEVSSVLRLFFFMNVQSALKTHLWNQADATFPAFILSVSFSLLYIGQCWAPMANIQHYAKCLEVINTVVISNMANLRAMTTLSGMFLCMELSVVTEC